MAGPELTVYNAESEADVLSSAVRHTEYKTKGMSKKVLRTLAGKQMYSWTPASPGHLRYVAVKELGKFLKTDRSAMRRAVKYGHLLNDLVQAPDAHEAWIVGVILYICLVPNEQMTLLENADIWSAKSMKEWQLKAKALSLRLKALQNTVRLNLTPLFEIDVLTNRGVGEVNWNEEQSNRTTNLRTTDHTYKEVFAESAAIFSKGKNAGLAPRHNNWNSFWEKRWEWAPTGSVHSQHHEDEKYIAKERTLRNKFYTLCAMGELPFSHFASRTPSICAWPSTKYEWGKMRAIYGVDLTSFIMAAFGMQGCEETLGVEFPIGSAANEASVRRAVRRTLTGLLPFCLDFDDFNSQHSISSMQAVIDAYLHVHKGSMSEEQKYAVAWTSKSISNMVMMGSEHVRATHYKLAGTLLSGCRLTTFLNTVLNKVYINLAGESARYNPSLHNGDDVNIGVTSVWQATQVMKGLHERGARVQPAKCFLGSIMEFLRIDHRRDERGQYLARSVATYVHGKCESIVPNDLPALIEAMESRRAELEARGADGSSTQKLFQVTAGRVADIWQVEVSELVNFRNTHRAAGGLSMDLYADTEVNYESRVENRELSELVGAEAVTGRILPGAYAYARKLTRNLFSEAYINKIAALVDRAVYSATAAKRVTLVRTTYNVRWWMLAKQKYGCYKHDLTYAKMRLVKMFGLPMHMLKDSVGNVYGDLAKYNDMRMWAKILL